MADLRQRLSGRSGERGASEVLAFVLLLGIVLTTTFLGVVYATDSLNTASDSQLVTFAQQEFSAVHNDLYEVASDVPYRSTEIDPRGGTITYSSDSPTITIEAQTGGGDSFSLTSNPVPLLFEQSDSGIYIEGGAVILQQENSPGHLRRPPKMQIGENRSIIRFLETREAGVTPSLTGRDSIFVVSHLWDRETEQLQANTVGGTTVTLTVTSPRYEAWAEYFEQREEITVTTVDDSTETVEAEFSTTTVVAVVAAVDTKYEDETSR